MKNSLMTFEVSEKTKKLQQRLQAFMDSYVYPNEEEFQSRDCPGAMETHSNY